jgi:hypothetical protein
MKSYNKPTAEQLDAAMPLLSSPQHEAYFFAHLENPHWIPALAERGVFAHPPKAEHVKGGGIRFPRWPPSRYLTRVTAEAPREVADIFAKIETDNASIIGDMLDAALAMPANISVSLVLGICRAAQEGTLWIHFKDASDLCVRLVEGKEFDAAIRLADALFTPKLTKAGKAQRRQGEYWYKDGLKKVVPILARSCAQAFLPKMCDWLKIAVETREHFDGKSADDNSCWWRPAIEEHEQNHGYEFAGVMAGFVREGFEQAIRSTSISLGESLQMVSQYSHLIFKRMRIHLIGEFADQERCLACQVMLDHDLFKDYGYKHEYAMLVGKRFSMLEPAQQEEWLGWVRDGPRGEDAEALDEPDDHALTERRRNYWRFQRLHWVRDYLTGEDKRFYQEMLENCGEPDMADLNVHVGPARWGSVSPMTVDELREKTFEQVLEAVSSWKPQGSRFRGPSMDGLASTFGQYLATDPEQFSTKAAALIDRPALFVRKFIAQMTESIKAGRQIDLGTVLELCQWVISRPPRERTVPEQEDEILVDEDWQWTRDDISRLLENVCKAMDGDVPRYRMDEFRKPIWNLIERLFRDPGESNIVYDTSQDARTRDYLDVGINSPRGKAIWAGLEYARWLANHIKQSDGTTETVPGGFDAMAEVRTMLEWQIAPENRTVGGMAVIGSFVGLIYWIDKQWLTDNAQRVFDLEEVQEVPSALYGWAAWNAFLVRVRPHIEYYQVLKAQFAYAVEQAAKVNLTERSREQPMYHLGEHLMLLYGRGQLELDDDNALLRRFIQDSNSDVRRHAISFIGESLEGEEEIPNEVIERFMTLWDVYWDGPGRKDVEEEPNAYLFGLWFSSGRFPDQWALDRLEHFVEMSPEPEPDHKIAERLAKIAHVDIAKSVRILDLMVRGDQEGWRVHGWLDSAKGILRKGIQTPGVARERSRDLIDHLGRRGYTDFGQLLKE